MKRYATVAMVVATIVLISFLIVQALDIPILVDPSDRITGGGWAAATIGGGLLLLDVFIPIPSSVIMIAHGAAFGVLGGFLLSLGASIGGAMIGWWIGQRGSTWMNRIVSPNEKRQANEFILKYGLLAIIISRLLPIIAETVAVMSGTTDLGWRRVLMATAIGSIPPALIYAIAGSATTDIASGAMVTAGVIILAVIAWLASKRLVPQVTSAPVGTSEAHEPAFD
jgi:uncharacterized membrane protein YdjX (TVP38/TMEM64 family)